MQNAYLTKLLLIFVIVASMAVGGATWLLMRVAIEQKGQALALIAETNAALISAVARFDQEFSQEDVEGGWTAATLGQIEQAYSDMKASFPAGEIWIVGLGAGDYDILIHQEHSEGSHPESIARTSSIGKLITQHFGAETAVHTVEFPPGTTALVAMAYIPELDGVLVAYAEYASTIEPVIRASLWALGFALVLIFLGAVITYRISLRTVSEAEENAARFLSFARVSADWFWKTDENHCFVSVGSTDDPLGDQTRDPAIGKKRWDMTVEDTRSPKWRAHVEVLNAYKEFRNFEYDARSLDGDIRTYSISGSPMFDKRGRFRGYMGAARDVTNRILKEKQLQQAEGRLEAVFRTLAVGVVQVDERGAIESFNQAAENMFGFQSNEVLGRNVTCLMPKAIASDHHRFMRHFMETGEAKIIGIGREVIAVRKDGTNFPCHIALSELVLDGRRHFLGAITDLSDVKAIEAQLRRSQKMDAVGQLTGGVAHDFNNLLGIILGNLDLMQRFVPADSKAHGLIAKAMRAAERGATLTKRLLKFSRQAPEANETVNVNSAILDMKDLLARSLRTDIEIRVDLTDIPCFASINVGDFEDALINLAVNARDAMPHGGRLVIETRITEIENERNAVLKSLKPGRYIEVAISDNGEGMTPEVTSRIFEPFFTTKEAGKGTGLGMALVYGFVQRSSGSITVYSEVGVGTTFRIYLPLATREASGSTGAKGDAPEGSAVPRARAGERILVVEDEPELAELAEFILGDLGYQVELSSDGPSALARLDAGERYDLIVSDVVMPGGITGFDVAAKARSVRADQPVLMVSGYTGGFAEQRSDLRPQPTLLRKPFTNSELAKAVRQVLDAST